MIKNINKGLSGGKSSRKQAQKSQNNKANQLRFLRKNVYKTQSARSSSGFESSTFRMGRSNKVSGEQAANALQLHSPQQGHAISVFFDNTRGTTPGGLIMSGRELLNTTITASSATPTTYVNTAVFINVAGTNFSARWSSFGALYQKWRVRALRATLVSNQPTTISGNNYIGFNTSANSADEPNTAAGIMRLNGAVYGNAYSDIICEFDTKSQTVPWFVCDTDTEVSTSYPGILNMGTDGYTTAVVPGKVIIDYEIEFADPK